MGLESDNKRVAKMVLAKQYASKEDIMEMLALASETDQPLGELMVEQGLLDERRLGKIERALQRQTQRSSAEKKSSSGGAPSLDLLPEGAPPPPPPKAAPAPERLPIAVTRVESTVGKLASGPPKLPSALPKLRTADPEPAPAEDDDEEIGEVTLAEERGFEPEPPNPEARERMRKLLKKAAKMGVSDLHLNVGSSPVIRLHGKITNIDGPALTSDETRTMVLSLLDQAQQRELARDKDLDFTFDIERYGRFRANAFCHQNGMDGSFRFIPEKIPTLEQLGIPRVVERLTHYHQGLVLITGPAGSGKTTTMAALIQLINHARRDNIICLEQPIEYLIPSATCNVVQRQIPRDSLTFGAALRAALREDPDVIMVGEMRDRDTVSVAVTAAETGHLVLGSLHTSSAARTVDRVLDVFPPKEAAQIRAMISESLRGVIAQQLVPNKAGDGVVAVCEILFNTTAVSNLIREERTYQLPGVIQTGKKVGMQAMDDALFDAMKAGKISQGEAHARAENKARFQ